MRLLVLLLSLCMPVVAWLSQRGAFGPTNGEVSNRYPTLLVAAGWAFAIWGLIFVLDVVYGVRQATGRRGHDPALRRAAPWAALGFAATAAWMPVFSAGHFWACVALIVTATIGTVGASMALLAKGARPGAGAWALPLHAGWLTLATFLNLAQTLVAYRLLPTGDMLGWSLGLLGVATVALLAINQRLRSVAYAAAATWGLVATYAKQSQSALPGASTAALAALVAAGVVALHGIVIATRRR